jgi:hypothetical protein
MNQLCKNGKVKNQLFSYLVGLSIIALMLSTCQAQTTPGTSTVLPTFQSTPDAKPDATPAPLWRFGVALGRNALSSYNSDDIASMRFGWYVDFHADAGSPSPYGMEYVPMLRVKQLKWDGSSKTECCVACGYVMPYEYTVSPGISQIQTIAANHPGRTWLIGNEMDRVDFGSGNCSRQDEMLPELYAQVYHDLYYAIKSADGIAQVAIGGMSEFTPLRSQYLQRVWDAYQRLYGRTMPVDIWNIHLYVLQEVKGSYGADIPPGFTEKDGAQYTIMDNKDFTKAWAQIVSLRTWMKDHGQQDKPLIISEFGVTYPAWVDDQCPAYPDTTGCPLSPEQVRDDFMVPSFDSLLNRTDASIGYPADGNRLVQRWNWFSLDYDDGYCDEGVFYQFYNGNLFHSGLGPANPPANCSFPARGLTSLGTYWKQLVEKLP